MNIRINVHLDPFTYLKIIYLKLQENDHFAAIINQIICFIFFQFQGVFMTKFFIIFRQNFVSFFKSLFCSLNFDVFG